MYNALHIVTFYMLRNVQYTILQSVHDLFSQSNMQYNEAFSDNIFCRKYCSLVLLKSSTYFYHTFDYYITFTSWLTP